MTGGVEIKNTVKVTFGHGAGKPSLGEILNFAKALDTEHAQIDTIYRIADEKSMCIKFQTEEAMLHTLLHNPEQLMFQYDDGKAVEVRMSNAGEHVQYVRVYDLPPEVPDKDLAVVLEKYGRVKRLVREKFPPELGFDIYTGIRGVYMDVKKEIPTSLHFLNRKGNIFYEGNKNVCFICKMDGHRMNTCPKRKPRKQPEMQQPTETRKEEENHDQDEDRKIRRLDTSSYAGVVARAATAETIEVLDEEVMAIDVTTPEREESRDEEQASGDLVRKRFDYRKDPTYLAAKDLFNQQQWVQEKQAEERKKLRARKK